MKYCKVFFSLFVTIMIVYFVAGQVYLGSGGLDDDYKCEDFSEGWYWVRGDEKTLLTLPEKLDVAKNEIVVIEKTLPDNIESGDCVCIRSAKQDIEVYVGGELRKTYNTKNNRLFGLNSPAYYLIIELSEEDYGKQMSISMQTDSAYTGNVYKIQYGNQMGIWYDKFHKYGAELIVAMITIVLGVICILGSFIVSTIYKRRMDIIYLGWGILICAFWIVTNSVFRQLLFVNVSVINDMPFMALMIMPIPFLIFINSVQKGRYKIVYNFLGAATVLDFVICCTLHMAHIVDFTQTIPYMVVVCMTCIVTLGTTIIIDVVHNRIRDYKLVAIGVLGAFLTALVQMVSYFQRSGTFSGALLAVGLMLLLFFSVLNAIKEIIAIDRQKQEAIMSTNHKAKFLANMSHEIRTPINAILGMNTMILRECKDNNVKEYAYNVQSAGQNLLSLINDILDFSKIESGKMELVPTDYDVSSMLNDVINMVINKANDKGLKFDINIDESMPSGLYGDDVRIRQILINILNNAVKYTEKGSVALSIKWKAEENDAVITFSVTDTGIGIRKEDLSMLFEEYERIDAKKNKNIEGTGLGMNITRQLLGLMDSRLCVESEYGVGSTFSFTIRQPITNREPIGNLERRVKEFAKEYTYKARLTAVDCRLLVVDDNEMNRKVFFSLLKQTKIQIDQAADGYECLELIKERKYDMIFMDHMMPGMDGIETLHRMREDTTHMNVDTPVIALTANAISGAKEMYLDEGFISYMSKPINPDKLEKLIMEYLPDDKYQYTEEKEEEVSDFYVDELELIDGIDWDYARLHLEDKELLIQTVRDFVAVTESGIDRMNELYSGLDESSDGYAENMKQYKIYVHGVKSQANLIGGMQVSALAKTLEYAARDNEKDKIDKIHSIFIDEWRALSERLKKAFVHEEAEDTKEKGDISIIKKYIEELLEASSDMDIDKMDDIMNKVNAYSYEDDEKKLVDRLSEAVVNLDEEKINEIYFEVTGNEEDIIDW